MHRTDLSSPALVRPWHTVTAQAAVRLLEAFDEIYDDGVDTGPLQAFAAEMDQHLAEFAERMDRLSTDASDDDRMYIFPPVRTHYSITNRDRY